MFLYWKKRGAYELEALPGDLAELELGAVERFSWSSALDIMKDLEGRCGPTSLGGLQEAAAPGPPGPPLARACVQRPMFMLLPATCSAVVWGPEPLLRAAAAERGLVPGPWGLWGHGGRQRSLSFLGPCWAGLMGPQPGWEQGSCGWHWAPGLGSTSVLCLQIRATCWEESF